MSVFVYVVLQNGPVPEGVVPANKISFGQNVPLYWSALTALAERLGVRPLDDFVVDHCGRVEQALREADWQEPEAPPEWGDTIPLDGSHVTDPAYLETQAMFDRIVEQVEAAKPWYDPAEGLRTVRALIGEMDGHPEVERQFYGAVWDLRVYAYELKYAEGVGTRFHMGISY